MDGRRLFVFLHVIESSGRYVPDLIVFEGDCVEVGAVEEPFWVESSEPGNQRCIKFNRYMDKPIIIKIINRILCTVKY